MKEFPSISIIDSNDLACGRPDIPVREEGLEILKSFGAFRSSVRDMLHQKGVYSNPGWTDTDVTQALANQLGVRNRYEETLNKFFTQPSLNPNGSNE